MGEREGQDRKDHDLLTRIDANLSGFMQKFESHTQEDKAHLDRLYDRTARIERIVWMGLGVIAAAEFVLRIMK